MSGASSKPLRYEFVDEAARKLIKNALARSMHKADGAAQLAARLGIDCGTLSRAASTNQDNMIHMVRLFTAMEIDRQGQSNIILEAWAAWCGLRLAPIERDGDVNADGFAAIAGLTKVFSEAADVARVVTSAGADGRYCAADRRDIAREIDQLIAALRALYDLVNGGSHR